MSTMVLIGRTPAACSLAVIHAGAGPIFTSATAAAYRGQSSASSIVTFTRSEEPIVTGFSAILARGSLDGSVIGLSYTVATSRARPSTLRQSGRFAVISKSMTASPSSSFSMEATSNPRRPTFSAISSAGADTSTNSRNQERTRRICDRPRKHETTKPRDKKAFRDCAFSWLVRKLLQESQVVLVEQPDVFDLIPQNRDALDADAPREAGVALGIVADRFEHRRVHHAAAAHLDPAGLLAHRAARAVALPATQIDFGARLGVGEETRPEPHTRLRRKHLTREREERTLEIRERNPFADHERLDLRERRRVRQVEIVAAVHASRRDDADRRVLRPPVGGLPRTGVRPQQRPQIVWTSRFARLSFQGRREVQRVLHVARGVFRRHVQCVEAVPLVFGFRTFDNGESHAREDLFELVADDGQRMTVTEERHAAGQRDVDRARRDVEELRALLMLRPARFDRLLQLVRIPADVFFLIGRRAGNQLHPRRDDAVLATEIAIADRLRIAGRLGLCELGFEGCEMCRDSGLIGKGHGSMKFEV